ncbi:MAG: hypothetical protein KKB21_05585, partial [Nanoarchaeota archaeon]|nr:hypothetical protein [Nanoarchaeota archaeon]
NPTYSEPNPEPQEVYRRHFVLAIPNGKRVLDNPTIKGLARVMQDFGKQFSKEDIVQFYHDTGLGAEHTTKHLGFTNNGSRGGFKVRYYFPYVRVFQKIGQKTQRETIETEYSEGNLESIAQELKMPKIILGPPKKVETKKPIYIENTFHIFPSEGLFRELAERIRKVQKRAEEKIGGLYDNPYQRSIYDNWPEGVCCSIDVEAGQEFFPNWRAILKEWDQKPIDKDE